jgi:hypothetical protein
MGAGVMIAKAILGGIGGGFSGASKGMNTAKVGSKNTDHKDKYYQLGYDVGNQGFDKLAQQKESLMSQFGQGGKGGKGGEGGDAKGAGEAGASGASGASGAASSGASSAASGAAASGAASAVSDETLKSIYGDSIDDKIIENFAKISAIDFTYNDEAKEKYDDNLGVDDKEHVGVIAQELAVNDATKGTVSQNENGDLEVDTRHLAFADTAAIAELSRRVLALEEAVKELKGEE